MYPLQNNDLVPVDVLEIQWNMNCLYSFNLEFFPIWKSAISRSSIVFVESQESELLSISRDEIEN